MFNYLFLGRRCYENISVYARRITRRWPPKLHDCKKEVSRDIDDRTINNIWILLKGIEGKFIKTPTPIDKHAERTFHIDRSLDPAMRELAKRIIPVCSNYSLIMRFVEGKLDYFFALKI